MNVFDLYEQAKLNPEAKKGKNKVNQQQATVTQTTGWDDSSDEEMIIDGQNSKPSSGLIKPQSSLLQKR
jgi:hypothetical protein